MLVRIDRRHLRQLLLASVRLFQPQPGFLRLRLLLIGTPLFCRLDLSNHSFMFALQPLDLALKEFGCFGRIIGACAGVLAENGSEKLVCNSRGESREPRNQRSA